MSNEIKKIDSIKNMAVFQDFRWDSSVRDAGNNIAEFKKINIFYGRNYSGKTTLSRIFRALETPSLISDYKYTDPEFQLSFDDGTKITQNSLDKHSQKIRVFNEDFVKDNLRFFIDEEQGINSFAILGDDNNRLEKKIKKLEVEVGNEENKTGLVGAFLETKNFFEGVQKSHKDKSEKLDDKLREKANGSIKPNKLFGNVNYNVTKIKTDITAVTNNSYTKLNEEQEGDFRALLKEEPKSEIKESPAFNLKYSTIANWTKELIEKKIQVSTPIQELLNDAALSTWVRTGREHHEGKREKCAFCGNDLPIDLWDKLDKHFNKESEDLRSALNNILTSIESEKKTIPNLLSIKNSNFYFNFTEKLDSLLEKLQSYSNDYCASLDSIKEQVEKRKNNIFTNFPFKEPTSLEHELNAIRAEYEKLRVESNNTTSELEIRQSKAREDLRLHEVFTFIIDIKYSDECEAIKALQNEMQTAEEIKNVAKDNLEDKQSQIQTLKDQLKDEGKGADRVNHYLNNFMGHRSLTLRAIEETTEDTTSQYRFEVIRNDKKAFHLSEGECSLIAFCYFIAKLEETKLGSFENESNKPIIWIDDPVSSLDANHIFFIYSLINAVIVKPKKFLQLFVSTHNLNFLKYLKQISQDYRGKGENRIKIREFFLVERSGDLSHLRVMPNYLKNYITEFNYLFHQIYKCAIAKTIDDENYYDFYNFGNNARKFLEIYLYYKYPNNTDGDDKLLKFFGEDSIPAIFTNRINNEYSHLSGGFERGASPIEVPEMKTAAKQIIFKIQEDAEQYSALLQSIGIKDDLLDSNS